MICYDQGRKSGKIGIFSFRGSPLNLVVFSKCLGFSDSIAVILFQDV